MPLTTAGGNALLTSGKAGFTHLGALTDCVSAEVSGGSYARQAVAWGTASGKKALNTGALAVPIPAGTTVQSLGLFDASTAGNLLGVIGYGSTGQPVSGIATVDATTDLFLSKAHGLTTDDRVFFSTVNGEAIPTGVVVGTPYFVLASGLTTDAFKISAASGGSALDVTVSGEAAFWKTVFNTFASAGNLTIAISAAAIDLTFG